MLHGIAQLTRALAVTTLLTTVVASPLAAQCSAADRAALESFDKAWGAATEGRDRAAIDPFLADTYMAVNPTGTTDKSTTLSNISGVVQAGAPRQPSATPDHYVISCTPLTATITHRNTIYADGGTIPTYSRSIHFLEKHGANWQAVSSTGHLLTDAQQLMYLEQDWNDASKRGDADWVEKNYASFASDVSSRTGGIETKGQAVASAKSSKTTYEVLDLSDVAVRVEGSTGVVTGVNHVRGKDDQGKAFDRRVRFTDTFIKLDGRWQVWATQGTTIQ